jgi:hypothetical protein
MIFGIGGNPPFIGFRAHLFPVAVFRLRAMRMRLTAVSLAVLLAALLVAAGAGAAMVGIYRNGMATTAQRAQLVKLSGRSCARGGSEQALRITIGKRTSGCSYRTPVLGRDLEVSASERLSSATPKGLQRKVFLGLVLRTGGGAGYQLAVYPAQQKVQLRKSLPGGKVEYLAIAKAQSAVKGLDKANDLRFSAINVASGPEKGQCHLLAYVGGKLVAEATDPGAAELSGGFSGVAIGSASNATGTVASVDNVVVRVPSPF